MAFEFDGLAHHLHDAVKQGCPKSSIGPTTEQQYKFITTISPDDFILP